MDDLERRIESYLADAVRARGIPGLAVGVVANREVICCRSFGVTQLGSNQKLSPEHVFHFASVSKPFVATAIVQLAERQAMNLDDRIGEILPYFRLADGGHHGITIRQILNHTSGLPDVEDYGWDSPSLDEGEAERLVRSIACRELLFTPGSDYRYSNLAFDALGDVIAKVSGGSFEEYMKTEILLPLGMKHSSFFYPEIEGDLRTTGHVEDPARVSEVYPYNRRHAPSSTLNSSIADMTRWIQANLSRGELDGCRILGPESFESLWTPSTSVPDAPGVSVGLSWFLGEREEIRIVQHAGQDTGYTSDLLLAPDIGAGVVMACNWDGNHPHDLCLATLDMVTQERSPG